MTRPDPSALPAVPGAREEAFVSAAPLPDPAPAGGWPVPAPGWSIDDAGVRSPRSGRTPWSEVDEFVQLEDDGGRAQVHLVTRDGRSQRIDGLATNVAALTRERAGQVEALNAVAAARRRPSELAFPVRLRTEARVRIATSAGAAVALALAVFLVVVAVREALPTEPLMALFLLPAAALMCWPAVWLLRAGWRTATISRDEVVLRTPLRRRRIPIADVVSFAHHNRVRGRRSCTARIRVGSGPRTSSIKLPGSDPDYRLPALDAHVRRLNRQD